MVLSNRFCLLSEAIYRKYFGYFSIFWNNAASGEGPQKLKDPLCDIWALRSGKDLNISNDVNLKGDYDTYRIRKACKVTPNPSDLFFCNVSRTDMRFLTRSTFCTYSHIAELIFSFFDGSLDFWKPNSQKENLGRCRLRESTWNQFIKVHCTLFDSQIGICLTAQEIWDFRGTRSICKCPIGELQISLSCVKS